MDSFATRAAYSGSPLQTEWNHLPNGNLLDSAYESWYRQNQAPWGYDQMPSSYGQSSYGPVNQFGNYAGYEPLSGFTSKSINADINEWLQRKYPELFDWESGTVNMGGGISAGDVSRNPGFGQFAQTPGLFDAIQNAANAYGVPANFLKVMIARESSGDWARDGGRAPYISSHQGRILPFVGIFDFTLASRVPGVSFDSLIGNMQGQVDAAAAVLRSIYDEVRSQNPQYGWLNVAAMYYSGDPSGATNPAGSEQYGSTREYMASVQEWWSAEDTWVQQNGGQLWREDGSISAPTTAEWKNVNQWDQYVLAASGRYGVPANLIKAIIRAESGGDPSAISPVGASGLMQVMPDIHNADQQRLLTDPGYAIDVGTRILKENFDQYGSWDMAAKAYLGLTGTDSYGTDAATYWSRVNSYWSELDANASGMFGGATGKPTEALTNLDAIWGGAKNKDGTPFGTSQQNGDTNEWVQSHPDMYAYSYGLLGHLGHPGDDWVMPAGTQLYAPASGEVIVAGGSGSYGWYGNTQPQTGELRIRLDNGHEIILGHMSGIHVTVGQRVTAGQYVGLSGGAGSGDHLHLEYRIPNPSFSSGWQSVDPSSALRGIYGGSFTTAGSAKGAGVDRPYTYKDLLRAGASGSTIFGGKTGSTGSGWSDFLRSFMRTGQPPAGYSRVDYANLPSR
ncbi:MAG TPA: transglycosylase SLT domain-containing protein [Thermomicrobiales bacterium]|nr:transglycosylase SLT domain-containing protein [Thermomicrobiales bacterium]